jgi:hypothetical protein
VKAPLSTVLLAVVGISSTAMAQHAERCGVDDRLLNRTVTTGRNAWARRCGFISQNKEIFLNEEDEYQIFSNGCYAYPNIRPSSTCVRHVPVSESEACIPLNELYLLGTCPIGYTLAARKETLEAGTPGSGEALEEVISFKLANGRDIEVPAHLLLVDGEGNLVKARTLAPGDELLGSDGQKVSISDIHVSRFQGYVWDLLSVSPSTAGNIPDVEASLSGTAERDSP